MGRYAVIDIGTNSVKLFAGRVVHGRVTPLTDELAVTRLGQGLSLSGELTEEAMTRTARQVAAFRVRAEDLAVEKVVAVGTEALRSATNADEFLDLARRLAKLRVQVLDGQEEARLAHLAVRSSLDNLPERLIVIDAGGGSTEFVAAESGRVLSRASVPVGSRVLTDRLVRGNPPGTAALRALHDAVREAFAGLDLPPGAVVAVGGAPTTMATVSRSLPAHEPAAVHGSRLSREEIGRLAARFAALTLAARRRLPGLMPARADVALAGAVILEEALARCGADELTVCARGLRHGVFHDRFAPPPA
ncbi:MAG: Ppx/GppA family phosphatase [bacterium]|nr:Ppx/GppA family phosphatase [bacterium]